MNEHARIASTRHTAIVVAILLGVAVLGALSSRSPRSGGAPGSAIPVYLYLIVVEWLLVAYVRVGTKKAGTSLRDLIGARWRNGTDAARDFAIAAVAWVVWTAGASLLGSWGLGAESSESIAALLPRTPAEIGVWMALSLTAGFCEELVYRGYLQRQLHARTQSPALAVLGQALLFGISHGYQGLRNVIVITIYGVLFGWLAWWRRSLKPGMVLHAWTDVFGGIFERRF